MPLINITCSMLKASLVASCIILFTMIPAFECFSSVPFQQHISLKSSKVLPKYPINCKYLRWHNNHNTPLYIGASDTSNDITTNDGDKKEPSVFDQVASKGLAGVLAITVAESIF